jgi:signal transduction histidine kinase
VLVIFGLLIVLTTLLSRGIARPIEALGTATNAVAAGRGSIPPVPATAAVEIQALYRDFAAMAAAIDRRSRYLRDFAHAVSHEFKTPLAGIRGALELLHDHDATMTPADRRRFLANADADADRLVLLVTRLLELARADMTVVSSDAVTDLAPILHALTKAPHASGLTITVAISAPLPFVAVPAASLERALTAIFDNSRQAGAARTTITGARTADGVTLTMADDGPGIAPADRPRIFEPFFTTRRIAGGSGLGLPIVRSLLESAGAKVALAETEVGTMFVLTMPAA